MLARVLHIYTSLYLYQQKHIDANTTIDDNLLDELLKGSVSFLTVDDAAKTAIAKLLANKKCKRLEIDVWPVGEIFHVDPSHDPAVLKLAISLEGHQFLFALHNVRLS